MGASPQPHRDTAESFAERAHARTGISFALNWSDATSDAIDMVMSCKTTAPDLAIVFTSAAWSNYFPQIIERVCAGTGCHALIGSSASGIIAGETCHETAPGITIMAMWLPGAVITTRRIASTPTEWPWQGEVELNDVRGMLMFSDPYRVDAQNTIIALRELCPGVPMIGALATKSPTDHTAWVFVDDEVHSDGAVALTIEGPYDLLVSVSQGGTPTGEIWTMTEVDRNRIVSISNRPATEVLRDTLALPENRGLTERDLRVGLPMNEYQDSFDRDDFVARGIIGTDPDGAIRIGGIPRQGQSVHFLSIDPLLASEDLHTKLEPLQSIQQPIVGGLLSTCKSRGSAMFGRNNHDAHAVATTLPDVPVVGLYSMGELAPVRGVPAYNAFAAALGLIVER